MTAEDIVYKGLLVLLSLLMGMNIFWAKTAYKTIHIKLDSLGADTKINTEKTIRLEVKTDYMEKKLTELCERRNQSVIANNEFR